MALQVWLPLNGTLENKGLSNVTVTNNGATVDNNGKIGKCYLTDGSHYFTVSSQPWMSMKPDYKFSLFIWVKGTTSWLIAASGWELILRDSYACIGIYGDQRYPARHNATYSSTTWYHLGFTWDGSTGKLRLYINGEEKAVSDVPSSANFNVTSSLKLTYAGPVYINDFRIYDHCLSPKEVKEISKGLILHYKLDGNDIGITIPRNGGLIPDGVELYDYILSSGTLWINTGVNGHMNHKYELDYQLTGTGSYRMWGVFGQSAWLGYNMSITYAGGRCVRWSSTSNGLNLIDNIDNTNNITRHTIIINKGLIYYDGTDKGKSSGHSDSCVINYPIYLFTVNPANTTPTANAVARVYRYKDTDISGNAVRNMLPCTYLGEPGMWDTVENKFYRNQGTGLFTLGSKITLKEYEYLETNATNLFINTGISVDSSSSVAYDMMFKYEANGVRRLMGPNTSGECYFGANSNNKYDKRYTNVSVGNIDHIYEEFNGITGIITSKINGVAYTGSFSTKSGSLLIFALTSGYNGAGQYFYSGKILKNNYIVRDFIPVSYNGTPGLWDKVEWKFYGNSGSGSFTLGPEKTVQQDAPIFYDSSGYCNHGSITGTLTTNNDSPRYTKSTVFNGSSRITSNNINLPGTSLFTISCWVYRTGSQKYLPPFWLGNGSSSLGIAIHGTATNRIEGGNGTNRFDNTGSTGVPVNTWTHLVLIYNGSNVIEYLNGSQVNSIAHSYGFGSTLVRMYVGYFWGARFTGRLSDVRLYATALSEDDIKELYNTSAFVTNNGVFAEYELYEDNLSDVNKRGLLETANFYENGAESGYALDTDKTRVASNYIISEEFIEI